MKQVLAAFFGARDALQNQDNRAARGADVDRLESRIENKNPVGHKHTFRLRQSWTMANLNGTESEADETDFGKKKTSDGQAVIMRAKKCGAKKRRLMKRRN